MNKQRVKNWLILAVFLLAGIIGTCACSDAGEAGSFATGQGIPAMSQQQP